MLSILMMKGCATRAILPQESIMRLTGKNRKSGFGICVTSIVSMMGLMIVWCGWRQRRFCIAYLENKIWHASVNRYLGATCIHRLGMEKFQSWVHASHDNYLMTPNGQVHRLLQTIDRVAIPSIPGIHVWTKGISPEDGVVG